MTNPPRARALAPPIVRSLVRAPAVPGPIHRRIVRALFCFLSGVALSGCELTALLSESRTNQPPVSHVDPDHFDGFDPRRIPVEMQAWWTPNFGHIHAAAKVPLGQEVRGVLDFEVRIVLHDNPSRLYELRIDTDEGVFLRIPLDEQCPYDGVTSNTCAFSVPVRIDTRDMSDGWRELRIRATVRTPDDKRFLNSSGIPILVSNGNPRDDYERDIDNQGLIGRGWYEDFDYTNAWIGNVPIAPVRGDYTFWVRSQKESEHLTVALDKTHHIPAVGSWPEQPHSAGEILFDADGEFDDFFPIVLDTRPLANGWHSIAVTSRSPNSGPSDCSYCDEEPNHPAGVAKAWFFVDNR